jgi:N6-adenosine-specific RNA methylase IME4
MTTKLPVKYNAAFKALDTCYRVDEVKEIRSQAAAMEVYALEAKDSRLIARATAIKMRATRRIGELMIEMRKSGQMSRGSAGSIVGKIAGTGKGKIGKSKALRVPRSKAARSLDEQGIHKTLAQQARTLARITAKEFNEKVDKAIELATASIDGNKGLIKQARAERNAEKMANRVKKQLELAQKIASLPDKTYGVIYADPGWEFETYNEATGQDRAAANHFTVQPTSEIRKIPVPKIAAQDCILFLWATVPMLNDALEVMAAWEFNYVTNFCWVKDRIGTGYWNQNQHELLLVGTKGKPAMPAAIVSSVVVAARGAYGAKPVEFAEMIEKFYPDLPKIEMNRRGPPRSGWDAWGNEAQPAPAPVSVPVEVEIPATPVVEHTVAAE